jgi:hypothetical protein
MLPATSVVVVKLLLTQTPGSAATHGAAAVYRALRSKRLKTARVLLKLIAPEHMATSWPVLVAVAPSEEALFRALEVRLVRIALAPEALSRFLKAAIQHGHTRVARMLRFCGATCSLDEATEPGQ